MLFSVSCLVRRMVTIFKPIRHAVLGYEFCSPQKDAIRVCGGTKMHLEWIFQWQIVATATTTTTTGINVWL